MATQTYSAVLLILCLLPCALSQPDSLTSIFSVALITSSSEDRPMYQVDPESTMAAVDLAIVYTKSNPELLPAINLTYGAAVNSLKVNI